jgi:hypothetical protein
MELLVFALELGTGYIYTKFRAERTSNIAARGPSWKTCIYLHIITFSLVKVYCQHKVNTWLLDKST